MKKTIHNIRLSQAEKDYAREKSKRIPGCKNINSGSVAYTFKYLLHREAESENIDIGPIYDG